MDAKTIDTLAALSPESSMDTRANGSVEPGSQLPSIADAQKDETIRMSPLYSVARDRFISKYVRTNFGWYIAKQFAVRDLPFPIPLLGRDVWVHKAYLMLRNPVACYDPHIAEAYYLFNDCGGTPNFSQYMKSIMLSFNDSEDFDPLEHIDAVSSRTGLSKLTVEAFESLFYNIMDRRKDALYLAHDVYPQTRLVEFDENYLKHSSFSDLLKRVAYNQRSMDLTAYLSGIGDHTYLKRLSASDNRESELTRYLMGNGLILAHTNLLNQRSVGISRVSNLLAASRQGGADADDNSLTALNPLVSSSFKRAISGSHEQLMAQLRRDSGDSIDEPLTVDIG